MDSYLDIDLMSCEQKPHILHHQQHQHGHYSSDGVVPVQNNNETSTHLPGPVVDGFPTYEIDFAGSKPYMYNFTSQSISQSVCICISLVYFLLLLPSRESISFCFCLTNRFHHHLLTSELYRTTVR